MPTHYAITLAAKQNYAQFFMTEMANRKMQNYPPFSYLCCISFRSKSQNNLDVNIEYAMDLLKQKFKGKDAKILGPITPYAAYKTENIEKQMKTTKPDIIEVLPGPMPKVVHKIVGLAKCPVIAGGLVSDKEDVMALLSAGASSISSTNTDTWFL